MLSILHEGHSGITKMKLRAQTLFYWPSINEEIEALVKKCNECEKYRAANPNNPLIPHDIPNNPYEKVGIDILEHAGRSYLVIMDYFSKWLDVIPMKSKNSTEVIKSMKDTFATHGIPAIVISDNMPFSSYECKQFAKEWDFEIITSSPHLSRSNGQAESGVKIAKSILKKTKDLNIALMEYRNTTIPGLDKSPAQLMYGRLLKTKLPIVSKLLKSTMIDNSTTVTLLQEKQNRYKRYFDKNTMKLKNLNAGENVVIKTKNDNTWKPAKIIEKVAEPRSFIVQTQDGNKIRRSRQHMRKSEQTRPFQPDIEMADQSVAVQSQAFQEDPVKEIQQEMETTIRPRRNINPPKKLSDYVL